MFFSFHCLSLTSSPSNQQTHFFFVFSRVIDEPTLQLKCCQIFCQMFEFFLPNYSFCGVIWTQIKRQIPSKDQYFRLIDVTKFVKLCSLRRRWGFLWLLKIRLYWTFEIKVRQVPNGFRLKQETGNRDSLAIKKLLIGLANGQCRQFDWNSFSFVWTLKVTTNQYYVVRYLFVWRVISGHYLFFQLLN